MPADLEFSVVVPCYNEEGNLDEFHRRLCATMNGLGRTYEIVYVNDGSTDGTLGKLNSFFDTDHRVSAVIDLYANVGQLSAMTPGIVQARGEACIFIDCDLQVAPEDIPALVARYDAGCDHVHGCRRRRRDPLLRVGVSKVFNFLLRQVIRKRIRDFGCNLNIVRGPILRAAEFGPFKPFRPIYIFTSAGRYGEVDVDHSPRSYGKGEWRLTDLALFALDNLLGSAKRSFMMLSFVCFALAFAGFAVLTADWLSGRSFLPSGFYTLVMASNLVTFPLSVGILLVLVELLSRNYLAPQLAAYIIRSARVRPPAGAAPEDGRPE